MDQKTIAVIGGGLRGIAAARAAAKLGCRTYLIEPRQFLGHELTATNHTWLHCGNTETTLQIGAVRKKLLAAQVEYGVQPLLASHAGAVAVADGKACGVLIANAYGTQLLRADAVIDTEGTLFAKPYNGVRNAEVHYAFTLCNIDAPFFHETTVDTEIGVLNDRIVLHPNARPSCVTVEFAFTADVSFEIYTAPQRLTLQAQRKAVQILDDLRADHAVFSKARLHDYIFQEVWLQNAEPLPQRELPQDYYVFAQPFTDPIKQGELENMNDEIGTQVRDICRAIDQKDAPSTLYFGDQTISLHECKVGPFDGGGNLGLLAVTLPNGCVPCRERTKAVVAGAGTAGIQAMRALLEKNIPFAAVEANTLAGGTHTIGLVLGYWNGYTAGLNAALDHEVVQFGTKYNEKAGPHWCSAKVILDNYAMTSVEDHLYMLSFVCGAEVIDGRVHALLCCNSGGLFTLQADVFIDASGDGAAAVHAGAEYACGDDRDGITQSHSQWGECTYVPSYFLHHSQHGDFDIADVDSYADMLRCMIFAQRHISDMDYSPMLTVRESRRITGDYVLTMADIWHETAFEDTLAVTDTPFDTHGTGSSAFSRMGMMRTIGHALRARIPYRSYLVRGLENMLITAKAFSATRDASSICRMNPDLRHAGYAVGLAAAQAILTNRKLREVDLKPVQAELLEKECLPAWTFEPQPFVPVDTQITEALNGSSQAMRMLYLAEDNETQRALRAALRDHSESDTLLSMVAWHNDADAVLRCAARAAELIAQPYTAIDDAYTAICRHVAALAHAKHATADMLLPIIVHAQSGGAATYCYNNPRYENTIYGFNRTDCWKLPCHALLQLLADAVERHAGIALAAAMDDLLARDNMSGYLTHNGQAPHAPALCHGIAPAFCSFLELRLTAAAARCASARALLRLAEFAEEDRAVLRKFAVKELTAITGCNLGENTSAWQHYLTEHPVTAAVPYDGALIVI